MLMKKAHRFLPLFRRIPVSKIHWGTSLPFDGALGAIACLGYDLSRIGRADCCPYENPGKSMNTPNCELRIASLRERLLPLRGGL
jgi:hypothetical protein